MIHFLQRFAATMSAHDAASGVVLVAAMATAVVAHFRAPDVLRRHGLAIAAVVLGALVGLLSPRVEAPAPLFFLLIIIGCGCLACHTIFDKRSGRESSSATSIPERQSIVWITAAAVLYALFIFADLGGYAGGLMVWEPESMQGLVDASKDGVSWSRFAATRLLWGHGLVSTGSDSLLYGTGTYALWKAVGAYPFTLRLTAALLGFACIPLVFRLGNRFAGATAAQTAAVVAALNPVLIYYGRYGVALTATIFALLLLLTACHRMIDETGGGWWLGIAAAGAAFLATLGYAPGRVAALAVVTATFLFAAASWRSRPRSRRLALILMVAVLACAGIAESTLDMFKHFVDVRGEHVVSVSPRSDWVREILGDDIDPAHLTIQDRLAMATQVIAERLPELETVYSFSFLPAESPWHVIGRDPPDLPLIQGPLLVFALWGLVLSMIDWRRGWPLLLIAVMASVTLPVLLTNRLDVHRLSLSSLPLIVWASLGLVAASEVMRSCRVPRAWCRVAAAGFFLFLAADISATLYYSRPTPRSYLAPAVHEAIDSVSGPLAVGMAGDHMTAGEIEMILVNRHRLDPDLPSDQLPEAIVTPLIAEDLPEEEVVVQIEGLLHQSTVILAPLDPFSPTVDMLRARGIRARVVEEQGVEMWRLDKLPMGSIQSRPADRPGARALRPEAMRPSTEWTSSFRIPITESHVMEVYHGAVAPRIVAETFGEPIFMRRATFAFGVFMRGWTHVLVTVPEGAHLFEAVIGLSDAVSSCEEARATFEVWGDNHQRLFTSTPVTANMPLERLQVPIAHHSSITLVMTEAGNGPECDEGIWAEPRFIFPG